MKKAGIWHRVILFRWGTAGWELAPAVHFGFPAGNRKAYTRSCPAGASLCRAVLVVSLAVLPLLLLLLSGCSRASKEIERGMALRSSVLKASACSFDTRITADYGDKLYSFSMSCEADSQGDLSFVVTAPETIASITGEISGDGGRLTFDATALQFALMADDQVTPVSAPWIFLETLRSGCLTSAGMDGEQLRLSIDDSYADDALHLDIWLDSGDIPVRSEILYDGRRILSLTVENFQIS